MANVLEPGWVSVDNKVFKGTFPDQQVSVHHLLDGQFRRAKGQLLADKTGPHKLSYFHIPANYMIWVEQAIASYFRESAPEPGGSLNLCRRTNIVLQDSYWRGQQHDCGPESIVHNRNLCPICEKILINEDEVAHSGENTRKNLVLFMPYLHWKTDRRRNQNRQLDRTARR